MASCGHGVAFGPVVVGVSDKLQDAVELSDEQPHGREPKPRSRDPSCPGDLDPRAQVPRLRMGGEKASNLEERSGPL